MRGGRYRYWREERQLEFRYNNKDVIQSNGNMCCNLSKNDLYVLVIYVIPNFQIIQKHTNQSKDSQMIRSNQSREAQSMLSQIRYHAVEHFFNYSIDNCGALYLLNI